MPFKLTSQRNGQVTVCDKDGRSVIAFNSKTKEIVLSDNDYVRCSASAQALAAAGIIKIVPMTASSQNTGKSSESSPAPAAKPGRPPKNPPPAVNPPPDGATTT